jgi:ferredoxin
MANVAQRVEQNAPGAWYVDDSCIDCELCRESAPDFFTRDDDSGLTYVVRQPVGADEEQACEAAMSECPVEAIGNDGA